MLYQLGKLSLDSTSFEATINPDPSPGPALGFVLTILLANSFRLKNAKITTDETSLKINFDTFDAGLVVNLDRNEDIEFYKFRWYRTSTRPKYFEDKLDIGNETSARWYGGGYLNDHSWPIRHDKNYDFSPFVLSDVFHAPLTGQDRYWLCSKKIALHIPQNVPLWTQLTDGQLSLTAINSAPYFSKTNYLEYEIAVPVKGADSMSLKEFHLKCFAKYLKAPLAMPDRLMIEKPIWTTWAVFKADIDQSKVMDYARGIVENNFPISHLELDDKWTSAYGDYEIDSQKFPDFSGLVQNLSAMGVPRITAWVHPFINPNEAKNGNDVALQDYFLKDVNGNVKTQKWWNGDGYVLDMTNPEATAWFRKQLENLQKQGIYTYKFDAGEINFLPEEFTLTSGNQPNDYGTAYAKFAASFGSAVENRFGAASQESSFFLRTMDRNSNWDISGGLSTLIPWMLSLSLHGYFWNLPDMVGGNAYDDQPGDHNKPERELFIRWTQANTFMMAVQFSYTPWQYDNETVEICRNMLNLRAEWMPYILESAENAVKEREPIMRPVWWAGDNEEAFSVSDQFLVGERLLVAPVVEKGKTSRWVLLPPGVWKDGNSGEVRNIVEYEYVEVPAPLDVLPYFERVMPTTPSTSTAPTTPNTTPGQSTTSGQSTTPSGQSTDSTPPPTTDGSSGGEWHRVMAHTMLFTILAILLN